MEYKFKVGDEVKVVEVPIELEGCVNEGSVGVITCIDDKIYFVKSDSFTTTNDKSYWFSKANLSLANKQVEDKVKSDKYNPLDVQQSGDHYNKRGIQPIEYGIANSLSFPQVNIVKYVTRHEDKNGIDDLAKSIHYHFFEALRVYGEDGSTQLRDKVLKLLNMEGNREDNKEGNK